MTPLGYAEESDPRYVYTFWNGQGRALYVGCTVNFARRLVNHQGQRPWFGEVTRIDVTVHTDHSAPAVMPCRRCRKGVHGECVGINRDGDVCLCQVCARALVSA